ncbi:hypothetical protein DI09_120p40 [Mitosporidium daphniae]|uniref:Uncharacterized protein n=1 Tax=Mitosporidium daphniae TaxID=1485682 RepID=A0A098VV32_9MICR|nr:uncharacterized protein DI09_124p20 [Mitosporidium daphniae]XP_013239389.1 uncharacterized protein DI09_120p40 [Mitosporidium daphniae]KGG52917.1 hypothetical protein DI09_124p20 [Mitosporidium daphniae]KGG52953.1 hypothetical protein DI09_120p40 [Mitosporidium daphniae]|eukprot:XP_013239353.1 uncharacterized protein DI09_124p20 [Mitosporidium daphniae]
MTGKALAQIIDIVFKASRWIHGKTMGDATDQFPVDKLECLFVNRSLANIRFPTVACPTIHAAEHI